MKNLRRIILFIAIAFATSEANAVVRFGFRAGSFLSSELPMTDMRMGEQEIPVPDIRLLNWKKLSFSGMGIGPVMEVGLPYLCLETGFLYAQQNFAFSDEVLKKATLYQLEVPLNLKLRLGLPNFFGVFASAGVIASYQVANAKLEPANSTDIYDDRFRVGAQVGAGLQLFGQLELGVNYQMMLRERHLINKPFEIRNYQDPALKIYLTYFLKSNVSK